MGKRGGGVIPVGDAPFLGPFGAPSRVAGVAPVASGNGFWFTDAGGRVTRIGDGTW